MHCKRRNVIKGLFAASTLPLAASGSANSKASRKPNVLALQEGYYAVDGWVVTAEELRQLQKDGVC